MTQEQEDKIKEQEEIDRQNLLQVPFFSAKSIINTPKHDLLDMDQKIDYLVCDPSNVQDIQYLQGKARFPGCTDYDDLRMSLNELTLLDKGKLEVTHHATLDYEMQRTATGVKEYCKRIAIFENDLFKGAKEYKIIPCTDLGYKPETFRWYFGPGNKKIWCRREGNLIYLKVKGDFLGIPFALNQLINKKCVWVYERDSSGIFRETTDNYRIY